MHKLHVKVKSELYLYATLEAQGERSGILQLIDQHLQHQLEQVTVGLTDCQCVSCCIQTALMQQR